jgi:hypothetical protein
VLDQYSVTFLDQMINVVTASTVLTYALWAADPDTAVRLGTPHLLWTVPMVLYGIFRFLPLSPDRRAARLTPSARPALPRQPRSWALR